MDITSRQKSNQFMYIMKIKVEATIKNENEPNSNQFLTKNRFDLLNVEINDVIAF